MFKLLYFKLVRFAPLVKVKEEKNTTTSQNIKTINNLFVEEKESSEDKFPYELKGILKGEEKELVILEKVGEDKGTILEKGNQIDGYKIYNIDVEKGEVILRKGNISYKLKMRI